MGFGTDLIAELEQYQSMEFAIRREVLSAQEILKSVTCNNAKILQLENQIGVITPGAFADLIAIKGNPVEDISLLEKPERNIKLIMKAGRIYKNLL